MLEALTKCTNQSGNGAARRSTREHLQVQLKSTAIVLRAKKQSKDRPHVKNVTLVVEEESRIP